jgi:dihydrolipoamide dehydrogenase
MTDKFDLVVIGSGPGGYRAAVLAALRGLSVAIVEKGEWGGCCLNRGCVPKKTWHHTADLVARSRRFASRGLALAGPLAADLARAWTHQKEIVEKICASYLDYLARLGVQALSGEAALGGAGGRLVGEPTTTVVVRTPSGETRRLAAAHVILATGSVPRLPAGVAAVPGRVLTTDMLFDAPPPPGRRVILVGGGVVGAEFAYILSLLGCEVKWLAGHGGVLAGSRLSRAALELLADRLRAHGIVPEVGVRVKKIEPGDGGGDGVVVHREDGGRESADWVLLGTGRMPYTEGLGLAEAGVALDERGFVRTDPYLRTTAPGVYAIGDCVSAYMTANQAMADATIAVNNILDGPRLEREPLWVPEVVYSAVVLARVGLNEDLAEAQGLEPAVGFSAFETSPAALGEDDPYGYVRLIADMDSGALLGAEIAGSCADELIQWAAAAPAATADRRRGLAWLAGLRVNHPARAEEFVNAVETLAKRWGLAQVVFGTGSSSGAAAAKRP